MHAYIKTLKERRANAFEEMKSLLDAAEAEKRDLSPEEEERYDKLNASIDEDAARIKKYEEGEARAALADTLREETAIVTAAAGGSSSSRTSDWAALGEVFRGERRFLDSFVDTEVRALGGNAGTAFGSTFYDQVMVYERQLQPILQACTVLETASGEPLIFPRLTADPTTGGTVTAEAGTITEADPTISQVTLGSFKYAGITLWSQELDTDNTIGLQDLIARSVARELVAGYGAHLTTGTGTVQPWGFMGHATAGSTATGTASGSATDTFFSPYDLVTLYYSVVPAYRSVGSWFASTTAITKMRGARDSNKQFIWEPGINGGDPDRFLGKPVYESSSMAAAASASKSVAFGDFSRYFVRRLPMRVSLSTDYKFNTDQLALKTVVRIDGDLVDTIAVKYMVSANT